MNASPDLLRIMVALGIGAKNWLLDRAFFYNQEKDKREIENDHARIMNLREIEALRAAQIKNARDAAELAVFKAKQRRELVEAARRPLATTPGKNRLPEA
jgi:hypothetical protein